MTEQSDPTKNSPPDADAELPDAEFSKFDETLRVQEPAARRAPSRIPLWLSVLALLLAGAAAIGVSYVVLRPAPKPIAAPDNVAIVALEESVHSNAEILANLQQQLNDVAVTDSSTELDSLQQQFSQELASRLEVFESLHARLSNIENSMSSMQGISSGVRDNWLLAEAEYYMQIANAQLQLAGNPHLAQLALQQADDRILQLANPALTSVRRALSGELRALDAMSRPDIEGMTLTLASLASVVESLPIRQQLALPDTGQDDEQTEQSGADRALASLKSTLSGVVSVRRTDESIRPLIAPESAFFLRANLSLQLQVARLALLRGETAAFQQSLDDANTWLGEYYDTASAQVQSARQTILEVRDGLQDITPPDISESLRLLRQYNTLSSAPVEVNESTEAQPAT